MDIQQDIFLKREEETILSQIEELNKDLDAVRRLLNRVPISTSYRKEEETKESPKIIELGNVFNAMKVPKTYDTNTLTWEQKCVFILNELKRATVEDIIKKVQEYQPEVSDKTAKNVVTNKLSKLYRNKKINADTSGKKYIYFM